MAQPQGMILYNEYIESFEKLPAEDFKSLIVKGMRYNNGQEIRNLTPMAELLWPILCASIDHNQKSYEKRCEANREIAQRRERKRKLQEKREQETENTAREDVLFSASKEEQMDYVIDDSVTATAPKAEQKSTRHHREHDSSPNVTNGNEWSPNVTNGNEWSPSVTNGNEWSPNVTNGHDWSPNATNITKTQTETETITQTQTQAQAQIQTETETVTVSQAQAQAELSDRTERAEDIDGGCDGDGGGDDRNPVEKKDRRDGKDGPVKPTREEVRRYCALYALLVDPERFYSYYEERGWCVGGEPMQSWRSLADCWQKRAEGQRTVTEHSAAPPEPDSSTAPSYDFDTFVQAAMRRRFDDESI